MKVSEFSKLPLSDRIRRYIELAENAQRQAERAGPGQLRDAYQSLHQGWRTLATRSEREYADEEGTGAPGSVRPLRPSEGQPTPTDKLDFTADEFVEMRTGQRFRLCGLLAERARKLAALSGSKNRDSYLAIARAWDRVAIELEGQD